MRPLSQSLVLICLMFALVGQAYSYAAMSCEMSMDHSQHLSSNQSKNDAHAEHDMHSTHAAMNFQAQDNSSLENTEHGGACCMANCVCPTSGCGSAAFLFSTSFQTEKYDLVENYISSDSSFTSFVKLSLYRPPIFA